MSNVEKMITTTVQKSVVVEKKCDVCFKTIDPVNKNGSKHPRQLIPYFSITTHHNDWGNDSCDSYEEFDACCPECALKFTEKYLKDHFDSVNTRTIEIEHRSGWFLQDE